MVANWISRTAAALRRSLRAVHLPTVQLGIGDDAWNLDSDGRRLRHELAAMHARYDGQVAR